MKIFPVLVGYEYALDSFFVNRYANDIFSHFLADAAQAHVAPLTVMSLEALEGTLPAIAAGDTTWRELLESRFNGDTVTHESVPQALAHLRAQSERPRRRNQYLQDGFTNIYTMILSKYGKPMS